MKDRSTELLEARLTGAWTPVEAVVSGNVMPVGELRVAGIVFRDGHYEILDAEHRVIDSGDYLLDGVVSPTALDLVGRDGPHADRRIEAIIELDDERLQICYDLDGGPRPESTEALEDEQLLIVLTCERSAKPSS